MRPREAPTVPQSLSKIKKKAVSLWQDVIELRKEHPELEDSQQFQDVNAGIISLNNILNGLMEEQKRKTS